MIPEKDLREQLATCTRIFAMQGMIGLFGHVSVFQAETKTVFITPGMGSDKGSLRPEDMVRRISTASRWQVKKGRRWNGRFTRRSTARAPTPLPSLICIRLMRRSSRLRNDDSSLSPCKALSSATACRSIRKRS
jgi:hypothetical protein